MTLKLYEPEWSWKSETDDWLMKTFEGKSILNFPCGKSKPGYRVDINPGFKPDLIADLHNCPFKEDSFDVVICDPPYFMYKGFKWLQKLSQIARTDLLICTPYMRAYVRNFYLYKTRLTQQNANFYLKLYLWYKKKNHTLFTFGGKSNGT